MYTFDQYFVYLFFFYSNPIFIEWRLDNTTALISRAGDRDLIIQPLIYFTITNVEQSGVENYI